ncbi:hypothetical protein ACXC9Q_30420 [Kribbella sp. CWNU-51]
MTTTPDPAGPAARRPDVSEQIAAATRSVPRVAGLHGGTFGEIADLSFPPAGSSGSGSGRTGWRFTSRWRGTPVDVTVEDIVSPSIT